MKQFIEDNLPFLAKVLRLIKQKSINKYYHQKQQKQLKKVGKEALDNLKKAFSELNKEWFLSYGTLLGAYREKDFIGHDIDIDIGAFFDEYSDDAETVLQKYGFSKKHQFEVDNGKFALEETYEYKGLGIDIFYFKKQKDILIGYDFIHAPNMSWNATIKKYGGLLVRELEFPHEGLDKIEFLGTNFPIPKNPKRHLSSHYGESFMQKDVRWDPDKVKNVRVLKDKIGVMTIYGK